MGAEATPRPMLRSSIEIRPVRSANSDLPYTYIETPASLWDGQDIRMDSIPAVGVGYETMCAAGHQELGYEVSARSWRPAVRERFTLSRDGTDIVRLRSFPRRPVRPPEPARRSPPNRADRPPPNARGSTVTTVPKLPPRTARVRPLPRKTHPGAGSVPTGYAWASTGS